MPRKRKKSENPFGIDLTGIEDIKFPKIDNIWKKPTKKQIACERLERNKHKGATGEEEARI